MMRNFLCHIDGFLNYLSQKNIVSHPFEVHYGYSDETAVIQITAHSEEFFRDYIEQSLKEDFGLFSSQLSSALRQTHLFDLVYLRKNKKVVFTSAWTKKEQGIPSVLIHEVESFKEYHEEKPFLPSSLSLEKDKNDGTASILSGEGPKIPEKEKKQTEGKPITKKKEAPLNSDRENESLKKKIKEENPSIGQLPHKEMIKLKEENESLKKKISNLSKAVESLKNNTPSQEKKQKAEGKDLSEELQKMKELLQKSKAESDQAKKELNDVQKAEKETDTFQEKITVKDTTEHLSEKATKTISDDRQKNEELLKSNKENESLKGRISKMSQTIQSLEEKSSSDKEKITKENESLKEKNSEMSKTIRSLKEQSLSEKLKVKTESTEKKNSLNREKKENESLKKKISSMAKTIESLKDNRPSPEKRQPAEGKDLSRELQKMKGLFQKIKSEVGQTKRKLNDFQKIRKENEFLKRENHALKKKKTDTPQEKTTVKGTTEHLSEGMAKTKKGRPKRPQTKGFLKLKKANESLGKKISEMSKTIEALKERALSSEAKIESMRRDEEEKEGLAEPAPHPMAPLFRGHKAKALQKKDGENTLVRGEKENLTEKIKTVKEVTEHINEENVTVKGKIDENSSLELPTLEKKEKYTRQDVEYLRARRLENYYLKEIGRKDKQVGFMKEASEKMRDDLGRIKQKKQEAEEEKRLKSKELRNVQRENKSLKNAISKIMKKEHTSESKSDSTPSKTFQEYREEVIKLKNKNKGLENMKEGHSLEIKKYERTVQSLKNQVESLQSSSKTELSGDKNRMESMVKKLHEKITKQSGELIEQKKQSMQIKSENTRLTHRLKTAEQRLKKFEKNKAA